MAMFGRARRSLRDILAMAQAQNERLGRGVSTGLQAAYRDNVPVHARTYAETLAGNRATITERDFSSRELAALQAVIEKAKPQPRRREAAYQPSAEFAALFPAMPAGPDPYDTQWDRDHPIASAREKVGGGSVGYSDYGAPTGSTVRPTVADPSLNAVANTLGRFVFEPDGKGGHIAMDRYDFANPEESERAKRYRPHGEITLRGLLTMLGDAASGDVGAIGRGLLNADDARSVRVRVPK